MSTMLAAILGFVRRWLYCVCCGILAVLFAAGAAYLWIIEIPSLQASHASRDLEWQSMLEKMKDESTLRERLEEVRATNLWLDKNLVNEANLADNLGYFYKLEEQTKAQLPELHQVSSPASDKYPLFRRVSYALRVHGTYEQVAAFLLALETGDRLVKITTFNFARADPGGQTVLLDLNVEMLGKK